MKRALVIIYAIGAIVTSGHVWHHAMDKDSQYYEGARMFWTPIISVIWPFYWSAYAFKPETKEVEK